MKDEKEPLEQKQNSEEEEYSFLQEIIKDEAGDQAKWKHDVLKDSVRINIRTGGLLYFFCVQTVGGEEI